jgi:hypothetical protein
MHNGAKYSTRHKNCITHAGYWRFSICCTEGGNGHGDLNFHNWLFIILPDEKKLNFYHSSYIRWCLNVIFEVKNDIF